MLSRYSHSTLETFRQCPRKYWFQKIEKPSVPRRLYVHNHLGNAVHNQLKIAYQRAFDGRLYPLQDMLQGFEAVWEGEVRHKVVVTGEHQTIDDEIENGRRMLRTYHERYQPYDQGRLKLAEQMLTFELANCPAGFHVKPDRVWERDDGVVEICDYKTGKQMVAGARDPKFQLQMGLYQLGVQSAFPQFEEVEVAQYFLRHDEVIRYRLRPDELDELTEQFRSELYQIANAERLDDWPEKESGLCDFCNYIHLCPRKRHRLALEQDEADEHRDAAQKAADLADRYIRLDVDKKTLDAEQKALRQELVAAAKETKSSKLYGAAGHVLVNLKNTQKLPTKTSDPAALAELTALVRSWGEDLETCLKLDDKALMDLVRRGRLAADKLEQVKKYVLSQESIWVRAFPKATESGGD